MLNHLLYSCGALLLCYGCIQSQFKKTGLCVVAEVTGFVLMTVAYIV